ncbi:MULTISPECIES: TetR/AcrR family transcriptional regulator [unclassified Streptomyces]|uniref:TetR/AcrR family transcriptional regulator n=1 Tax=unclassified Streptomyces TaxID=2593676 RepID=UPI0023666613|nr:MULTISPECIES: TetR/AcrR family transcriptional regulator [unclassified Streptomyces]MDF3142091.1 helix-turn-helix domain containing protein [Streptomyces sp. T21Q-yed]WDF43041.1 helix-turn-helix domain containing protein [Streptomyces sp. T12]
MDAIAAEAGVSKVTVYNHFGSKQALFTAVITSALDEPLGHASSAALEGLAAAEDLRTAFIDAARTWVHAVRTNKDVIALRTRGPGPAGHPRPGGRDHPAVRAAGLPPDGLQHLRHPHRRGPHRPPHRQRRGHVPGVLRLAEPGRRPEVRGRLGPRGYVRVAGAGRFPART